ncbi:DNA replication complex GINS protein PSF3-like [Oppia nitens]|uniref:DNA replication complex GINS protein PSF3-like n=1 Tax=Oppia nitens TaxID=1686743 RepID=UPI0023DACCD8|nr:DNA replication complex GINS protein PSF3-like [Oppia nitens]
MSGTADDDYPMPSTSTTAASSSSSGNTTMANSTLATAAADTSIASTSGDGGRRPKDQTNNHYCDDYFDIDDIVANSQRVLCTFQKTIGGIGPLVDPNSDQSDIDAGTKLELPLWLARELYTEGLIDITVPKGYNRTYREIFEADANCVDLHKLCPQYYRFGQHLARLNLDESEDIAASLVDTYHQRYHRLVNYSLSASGSSSAAAGAETLANVELHNFCQQLDNDERQQFDCGKQAMDQMKEWHNRSLEKITANEVVVNLRKRKHIVSSTADTAAATAAADNS